MLAKAEEPNVIVIPKLAKANLLPAVDGGDQRYWYPGCATMWHNRGPPQAGPYTDSQDRALSLTTMR